MENNVFLRIFTLSGDFVRDVPEQINAAPAQASLPPHVQSELNQRGMVAVNAAHLQRLLNAVDEYVDLKQQERR